jgi:hypothetical protein
MMDKVRILFWPTSSSARSPHCFRSQAEPANQCWQILRFPDLQQSREFPDPRSTQRVFVSHLVCRIEGITT